MIVNVWRWLTDAPVGQLRPWAVIARGSVLGALAALTLWWLTGGWT